MWSHEYQFKVPLTLTTRGLFLLDINQLLIRMGPTAETQSSLKPKSIRTSFRSVDDSHVDSLPTEQLPELTDPDREGHTRNMTVTCNVQDEHDITHKGSHVMTNCRTENIVDQDVTVRPSSSPSCVKPADSHVVFVGSSQESSDRSGAIPDIPLADLEQEKLPFGKKHVGKSFLQIWESDQSWIQWFVSHYQNSNTPDHRKFLMFVEKKIMELEETGSTIPRTSGSTDNSRQLPIRPSPKKEPKAKSKGYRQMVPFEEEVSSPEEEFDLITGAEMTPMYQSQDALDVAALQTRMLNLENAMTEIITHLRNPQPQ